LVRRRQLAGQRVLEGSPIEAVTDFLGVHRTTVSRWVAAFRARGIPGLATRVATGRPPRLTHTHEKVIRRWLADKPTEHGFPTEQWTGPRVAHMIRQEFGVALNPKYMTVRLRRRGLKPQKPRRVPRQRDPEVIAAWLASDWPRIKKSPTAARPHRPDRREWAPAGGSSSHAIKSPTTFPWTSVSRKSRPE
jgi:transposase